MLSDYEQAVENRRKAEAAQAEKSESPAIQPELVETISPRTEKESFVALENRIHQLGEMVSKNALACNDNFAGVGRHVSELEGKLEQMDSVLSAYVKKMAEAEERLAKLEEPQA